MSRNRRRTVSAVLALALAVSALIGVGCGRAGSEAAPPAESAAGEVRAALAERVAAAGADEVVVGRDGWLYFLPELRHLTAGRFWGDAAAAASRAPDPSAADPLPAILDFKAQLDSAGIELIFVPVPAKAAVYPQHLLEVEDAVAAGEELARYDRELLDVLAARGVRVIDLAPLLRDAAAAGEPVYCRHDTHWSPRACVLAAERIAEELAGRPWLADVPKVELATRERTVTIAGDLWRELPEPRPPQEELTAFFVGRGVGLTPVPPSRDSPVVLLGDSHTLVFHAGAELHAQGAGLADHLARELGFAVDLVGVRGSGATPSRINLLNRHRDPEARRAYLAGKKVVVWCLSVREYTEGQGWKKVPVVPDGGT